MSGRRGKIGGLSHGMFKFLTALSASSEGKAVQDSTSCAMWRVVGVPRDGSPLMPPVAMRLMMRNGYVTSAGHKSAAITTKGREAAARALVEWRERKQREEVIA